MLTDLFQNLLEFAISKNGLETANTLIPSQSIVELRESEQGCLVQSFRELLSFDTVWSFADKKDKCTKGYPCGRSCINAGKNCRNPVEGQAANYAGFLELQAKQSGKVVDIVDSSGYTGKNKSVKQGGTDMKTTNKTVVELTPKERREAQIKELSDLVKGQKVTLPNYQGEFTLDGVAVHKGAKGYVLIATGTSQNGTRKSAIRDPQTARDILTAALGLEQDSLIGGKQTYRIAPKGSSMASTPSGMVGVTPGKKVTIDLGKKAEYDPDVIDEVIAYRKSQKSTEPTAETKKPQDTGKTEKPAAKPRNVKLKMEDGGSVDLTPDDIKVISGRDKLAPSEKARLAKTPYLVNLSKLVAETGDPVLMRKYEGIALSSVGGLDNAIPRAMLRDVDIHRAKKEISAAKESGDKEKQATWEAELKRVEKPIKTNNLDTSVNVVKAVDKQIAKEKVASKVGEERSLPADKPAPRTLAITTDATKEAQARGLPDDYYVREKVNTVDRGTPVYKTYINPDYMIDTQQKLEDKYESSGKSGVDASQRSRILNDLTTSQKKDEDLIRSGINPRTNKPFKKRAKNFSEFTWTRKNIDHYKAIVER